MYAGTLTYSKAFNENAMPRLLLAKTFASLYLYNLIYMHKKFFCFILLLLLAPLYAQDIPVNEGVVKDSLPPVNDPLYREDQFYTSVAYNLVQGKPSGYTQYALSVNLTAGFLRDIPLNEARNKAIAIGLGYSYNNIKHNLLINRIGDSRSYFVDTEDSFDKNKLVLHYLELPIELRWRNSNSISHKFWRVYAGFKVSYLFADKAQYIFSNTKTTVTGNEDLNKFVYGTYISAGWNTWNLYAYYGLNPIFKSGILSDGENVKLRSFNLGLMFYIL